MGMYRNAEPGMTYVIGTFDLTRSAAGMLRVEGHLPQKTRPPLGNQGEYQACYLPNSVAERMKMVRAGSPASAALYDLKGV